MNVNITAKSIGLIDNEVIIIIDNKVVVQQEIKGNSATKLFIDGFKLGIEYSNTIGEINENINI